MKVVAEGSGGGGGEDENALPVVDTATCQRDLKAGQKNTGMDVMYGSNATDGSKSLGLTSLNVRMAMHSGSTTQQPTKGARNGPTKMKVADALWLVFQARNSDLVRLGYGQLGPGFKCEVQIGTSRSARVCKPPQGT